MDYTGLVSQALAVVRRTRTLWIFAVIIALVEPSFTLSGSGSPGFSINVEPRIPVDEAALLRSLIAALAPFLAILTLYLVAAFFVAPLARGGVVWTAWRGAEGEDPPVSDGLRAARDRYGPLLLIQLLNLIVPLVVIGAVVIAAVPVIGLVALFVNAREPTVGALVLFTIALMAVLAVAIIALIAIVIAVSVVVQTLVTFASMDVVIAASSASAALRTAWQLFRRHLGPVVLITVLFALLSGLVNAIAAIPMAALLLVPIAFSAGGLPPFGLIFAGILILLPLLSLLQTPVQALRYTYFMLLYRGWTGRVAGGVTSR
jgi:hypothetical protein